VAGQGHVGLRPGGAEALRHREVDLVVRAGKRLMAIRVKSGRARGTLPGMAAVAEAFRPTRKLLVGEGTAQRKGARARRRKGNRWPAPPDDDQEG
jgi:hypothetical protein